MRIEDELGIRRTLSAYCHHIDDGEFDRAAEQFTSEATFVFGKETITGRPALARWFADKQPPERRGRHLTCNTLVDVVGDHVTAVSDFVFLRRITGVITIDLAGRYRDTLVKLDDRWLISGRETAMLP